MGAPPQLEQSPSSPGLCWARRLPLKAVPTLPALSQRAWRPCRPPCAPTLFRRALAAPRLPQGTLESQLDRVHPRSLRRCAVRPQAVLGQGGRRGAGGRFVAAAQHLRRTLRPRAPKLRLRAGLPVSSPLSAAPRQPCCTLHTFRRPASCAASCRFVPASQLTCRRRLAPSPRPQPPWCSRRTSASPSGALDGSGHGPGLAGTSAQHRHGRHDASSELRALDTPAPAASRLPQHHRPGRPRRRGRRRRLRRGCVGCREAAALVHAGARVQGRTPGLLLDPPHLPAHPPAAPCEQA